MLENAGIRIIQAGAGPMAINDEGLMRVRKTADGIYRGVEADKCPLAPRQTHLPRGLAFHECSRANNVLSLSSGTSTRSGPTSE